MLSMVLVLKVVGLILGSGYRVLRAKLCYIATGKSNVRRVALQEFDNRHIIF